MSIHPLYHSYHKVMASKHKYFERRSGICFDFSVGDGYA
ncbi:hypothetical protein A0O32_1178 [Anoxybacillus flavithermus]|nr:hypothetical protein A0O32_1178 [Anoxybacillus flavithermus]